MLGSIIVSKFYILNLIILSAYTSRRLPNNSWRLIIRNLGSTCMSVGFCGCSCCAFVVTLNRQFLHTQNIRKFVTFSSKLLCLCAKESYLCTTFWLKGHLFYLYLNIIFEKGAFQKYFKTFCFWKWILFDGKQDPFSLFP